MKNNLNKKRILVTGSNGFIGNYLIKKLTKYDVQKDTFNGKRIDLKNNQEVLKAEPQTLNLSTEYHQDEK